MSFLCKIIYLLLRDLQYSLAIISIYAIKKDVIIISNNVEDTHTTSQLVLKY